MSIATFSPFIKGVADYDSLPRIVIAVEVGSESGTRYFHTIDMNGTFELLPANGVTVDWRYNPATELWDDPNATRSTFDDEGGY
jgi:hypothetical protein